MRRYLPSCCLLAVLVSGCAFAMPQAATVQALHGSLQAADADDVIARATADAKAGRGADAIAALRAASETFPQQPQVADIEQMIALTAAMRTCIDLMAWPGQDGGWVTAAAKGRTAMAANLNTLAKYFNARYRTTVTEPSFEELLPAVDFALDAMGNALPALPQAVEAKNPGGWRYSLTPCGAVVVWQLGRLATSDGDKALLQARLQAALERQLARQDLASDQAKVLQAFVAAGGNVSALPPAGK